jgi:hypothetical protein
VLWCFPLPADRDNNRNEYAGRRDVRLWKEFHISSILWQGSLVFSQAWQIVGDSFAITNFSYNSNVQGWRTLELLLLHKTNQLGGWSAWLSSLSKTKNKTSSDWQHARDLNPSPSCYLQGTPSFPWLGLKLQPWVLQDQLQEYSGFTGKFFHVHTNDYSPHWMNHSYM